MNVKCNARLSLSTPRHPWLDKKKVSNVYELRRAKKKDYNFLYCLLKSTMKQYYIETYGSWDEEVEKKYFGESFIKLRYQIIVYNGHDVGCLAITNNTVDIFINEIQILPQYQNNGIGRMILNSIIEDSERLKMPIKLDVLKSNKKALEFYKRIGFIKYGETESHNNMIRNTK